MERIRMFSTNRVEIAEHAEGEDLKLKIEICDFSVNRNGVMLARDTIENWMGTLVGRPLQAKISASGDDFTSHNLKRERVVGADGRVTDRLVFDTYSYGVFTACYIENEAIIAECTVWASRYPRVGEIIEKRVASADGLHTSWEILSKECRFDNEIKVIIDGEFLGHCMLSATVVPAYDNSRILQVAEENDFADEELAQAILEDKIVAQSKEGENMKNKDKEIIVDQAEEQPIEQPVLDESAQDEDEKDTDKKDVDEPDKPDEDKEDEDDKDKAEAEPEVSELTEWDLCQKISRLASAKLGVDWIYVSYLFPGESYVLMRCDLCQTSLEYIKFSYEINGDDVTLGEPENVKLTVSVSEINSAIASRDDALLRANALIQSLQAQLEELAPIKAEFDKQKAEKEAAELKAKQDEVASLLTKSGLVTETELKDIAEIAEAIEKVDTDAAKRIIADRFIASLATKSEPEVETSESKPPRVGAIIPDETPVNAARMVSAWLASTKK